jgi:hypothetical protein
LKSGKRNDSNDSGHKSKNIVHRIGLFEECRAILKKTHETRTLAESHHLLKLIEKSEFLKEVTDIQGIDFVKGILRHAKL